MQARHDQLHDKIRSTDRRNNLAKDSAILDVITEEYGSNLQNLSEGQLWKLLFELAQDEADGHLPIPIALAASVNRLSYLGRIKLLKAIAAHLDDE
ncbi:MAG: hypothetical protein KME13_20445 [Myxacorys californica WJT36-NPBG1]|jgi:hypothetical protein|nr:hypothetical protein [Myxacorys californica WJT36-NPBG1]